MAIVEFAVLKEYGYAHRFVSADIPEEDIRAWALEVDLFDRKTVDAFVVNRITESDEIYPELSELLKEEE